MTDITPDQRGIMTFSPRPPAAAQCNSAVVQMDSNVLGVDPGVPLDRFVDLVL
jgi:hypothetical protein